jgi:hypothetical protein
MTNQIWLIMTVAMNMGVRIEGIFTSTETANIDHLQALSSTTEPGTEERAFRKK